LKKGGIGLLCQLEALGCIPESNHDDNGGDDSDDDAAGAMERDAECTMYINNC
jgi:hypothetical protein